MANMFENDAAAQAEIVRLRADVARLTEDLAGLQRDGARTARRAMRDGSEQLRAQGEAYNDMITDHIREKPYSSVAMAGGLGFVLALLLRR